MSTATAPAVALRARLSRAMQDLASARSDLQTLASEMEAELQAVRARYENTARPARQRVARAEQELERLCRAERRLLLPPGRRSLPTPFGRVGFRQGRPSVHLCDGASEGDVCRALRRSGLERFLVCCERPDRSGLCRAVVAEEVAADALRACGLEFVEGDECFYCELDDGGAR